MIETHHVDEGPGVDRDLLAAYAEAVTDDGVPEEKLVRVVGTVAGIDRETVRDRLHRLHEDDGLEEFATQSRDPRFKMV